MKRLIFCFCLLLVSQLAAAEIFWRYEKDQQVGYLLGSVHFANSSFYPLDKNVMAAYEQASVLLVEVDELLLTVAERQSLLQQYGYYPNNETIQDHLEPKTLKVIASLLDEFNVSLEQLKHYRPALLAIVLTTLQAEKLGYHAGQGIDAYFLQKARYKKTIRQIESFAFQMKLLSQLPEQNDVLQASFQDMSGYKSTWETMMTAWKRGDGDELYKQAIADPLKDYPNLADFFDILFFNRHPRMVNSVEHCVNNKESCFVVVGAGHLLGEKGLVSKLKQKGFKLKNISNRK